MQQWKYDLYCFWCQKKPWLFCPISFFMSSLSPASPSWHPLKNKNGRKKERRGENRSPSFCRHNTLPPQWTIAVTYTVGACISQGTHEISTVSLTLSLAHTPFIIYPKVFFDVSELARAEGDETEPLIKRQGHSEKQKVGFEVRHF